MSKGAARRLLIALLVVGAAILIPSSMTWAAHPPPLHGPGIEQLAATQDDNEQTRARPGDDQGGLQSQIEQLGRTQTPSAPPTIDPSPSNTTVPSQPSATIAVSPPPHATQADPGGSESADAHAGSDSPASPPPVSVASAAPGEGATTGSDTPAPAPAPTTPLSGELITIGLVLAGLTAVAVIAWVVAHLKDDPDAPDISTPDPDQPSASPDDVPVRDNDKTSHHCQGHRLGFVVGPHEPSVDAAWEWMKGKSNIQHKLRIVCALDDQPDRTGKLLIPGQPAVGKDADKPVADEDRSTMDKTGAHSAKGFLAAIDKYIAEKCQCCCHWDEIIFVMHGHQGGGSQPGKLWVFLLQNLPTLLGDRAIQKRFVLWVCSTATNFFPHNPNTISGYMPDGSVFKAPINPKERTLSASPKIEVFEEFTDLLRPQSCHKAERCNCSAPLCLTCVDADGNSGHRCPDGKQNVELYCSAWATRDGVPQASSLGMSDNRKAFTSPDGSIRKVTIHPNGDDSGAQVDSQIVTSTEGNPVDIFAGTPLQADDRLATGAKVDPKKELEQTHTKPPTIKPRTAVYSGPKCAEDARDGCLATT